MYQQSETNWFSQTIQTYKDKVYGTEGYLRIAIISNSDDHKNFNPPKLNITIQNTHSKNLSLSGENALELAMSLGQAIKSFEGQEKLEIVKKFKADLQFVIEIFQHEGKDLVKFTLLTNSSDFTVVVVPMFPTFIFFGKVVKDFSNNYFNICQNMFYKTFDSYHKEVILQIPSVIKGMSTQIDMPDEREDPQIDKEELEKTTTTIKDLDNFIGGSEMTNIKVPEIDNHKIEDKENKPTFTDVDSKLVTNILKNDLSSLENLISGLSVSRNPIEDFKKRLIEDGGYSEHFDPLSDIKEDDFKSLCYISRFTFLMFQKNYVEHGTLIPQSFSPLSFKTEKYIDENIELAYDLLLFSGYVRLLRTKLEMKIPNAVENKSIFHLAFRCFMDPFIFSFISRIEKDQLVSIILNRFRCYNDRGVFDKYKTSCMSFGVDEINEHDIRNFIENLAQVILGNGGIPTIDKLHKAGYESKTLRLTTQNDFNLEQITNEVIPLEVGVKLNNNEVTDELIEKIKIKEDISDEVIAFFKKKHTVKKEPVKKGSSNLKKMIDKFRDEVPEDLRDTFYEFIDDLGDKDFYFNKVDLPYEQFGDKIIKLLYLWKPEQDPKIAENFNHFRSLYGDSSHTRITILAKISSETESEKTFELNIETL
jgi:hypothetical protein